MRRRIEVEIARRSPLAALPLLRNAERTATMAQEIVTQCD
jgi:hypothetical protein